jgi:hypothetical protein
MAFARFMARPFGRGIRIALGFFLIVWGFRTGTPEAIGLAVFGFVPLLAGVLNVCPIGFLFGLPFKGKDALESASVLKTA